MTDREICEKIIKNGGCLNVNNLDCKKGVDIKRDCPFHDKNRLCSIERGLRLAKQWLKDHPEKYTYAEVDLPEWWDGRPIKGYAWDDNNHKVECYCNSVIPSYQFPYGVTKDLQWAWFKHFEPLTETPTTAKVSITKYGKTSEIELTAEQIEGLGL